MHDAVHRQRELRLQLLNAAYNAFIQDPDGFVDVSSLSFEAGATDTNREGVDFTKQPPQALELRASTYYLLERGLIVVMGADGLLRSGLKANDLMIHITAGGVDVFEGFVLSSESRAATRPVGFRIGVSQPGAARPAAQMTAPGPEDTKLES
jgi:hypothetical protein